MFNTWYYQYMIAVGIISLIEPLRYHGMRAAETGHALHVLKTGLYFHMFHNPTPRLQLLQLRGTP